MAWLDIERYYNTITLVPLHARQMCLTECGLNFSQDSEYAILI